uniref:FCP1 homology domain-containing protein n=1 Tax=Rhizophora mucronata TaxID=61149 RepID=A0A2P2NFV7_RHIMU
MQNQKRTSGRNASREPVSPRVSRAQKKALENVQVAEMKATELITSSARKQRCGALQKKNKELAARYNLVHDELSNVSSQCDAMDAKGCNEKTDQCVLDTIFSPPFHMSKFSGGDISSGVDFIQLFRNGDQRLQQDSGTDYTGLYKLDGFTLHENFQATTDEGKKYSENALSSVNAMHQTDVDVKANIFLKKLDVQDHGIEMLPADENAVDSCFIEGSQSANLSSEVSAIYLAMKNSNLECVDEHGQDPIPTDECLEDDDSEEFDDFDPYLFIKNLPELSSVVPTFRPLLLPKQTRSCPPTTLVLDLDETLVHSTLEPCDDADFTFPVNFNLQDHTVYVRCRPYLSDFMERVSSLFEIIIFTASQSIYAEQLLNVLDPKRKIFRHRVFRESCVFVEGNYLKDLSVLGRDLAHVIIVDNSPQAFGFQVDNGIPIESWFDDRSDQELLLLLPFLESLVGVEDVRPQIAKKYNLREKIAATVYPLCENRGDPFER